MRLIIYLCISMILGCLSSVCKLDSVMIGAAVAAPFLAVLFFTMNRKKFILCLGFFIIGFINVNIYFNFKTGYYENIRIVEKSKFYCLGSCKGRNIIIKGKVSNLKEGEKIIASGSFKECRDLSKGVVGIYSVKKYRKLKPDYIYHICEIKNNLHKLFLKEIGEENSALVMSLCFGETQYLKNSQKLALKRLGVIHAVSVSGFHMAIIYKVLENILGLKGALPISFLYLIFTGIGPSTIRAFLMIVVLKLSKILYKNYDSLSSLCFAAMIILLYKPYYICHIGFLLSFLSTLGIILYCKKIQRILWFIPQKLNESISLTLSAQCFSLPCIAFTIKDFSIGFILGNIFLVPIFSLIVILGNICLVFYKVNKVFVLLSKILVIIMKTLQGGIYLILKICPNMLSLSYWDGIVLLLIYISYILYKYKNFKFKYLPIFIMVFMIMMNYKFFPEIHYFNSKSVNAVVIKQGNKSFMVCDYDLLCGKEVINLKHKMKVNKVITNPEYEKYITINDDFSIIFRKGDNGIDNFFEVYFKNNKFQINRLENSKNTRGYDIIKENYYLYKIIFGKLITIRKV